MRDTRYYHWNQCHLCVDIHMLPLKQGEWLWINSSKNMWFSHYKSYFYPKRDHYWYLPKSLFFGVWCHFQQYFSYIVAVSFIGGNRSTRRKPLTCRIAVTRFITYNVVSSTQLTTFVVISTECISSCKSNNHTTTTTTTPTLPKETKVKNNINWRLNQNPILTQTNDYRFRRINIKFLSIEENGGRTQNTNDCKDV